jgi:hypothetical protein
MRLILDSLFEPHLVTTVGAAYGNRIDTQQPHSPGMVDPVLSVPQVAAQIGRVIVQEEITSRKGPDVALFLAEWHQTRRAFAEDALIRGRS